VKAILEELEGIGALGAGRRIFGWGLTGVVIGLGLAAMALVFESYLGPDGRGSTDTADDSDEDSGGAASPPRDRKARRPAETGRGAGPGGRAGAGRGAGARRTTESRRGAETKRPARAKTASRRGARARKSGDFAAYIGDLDGPLRELAEALDARLLELGNDTERVVLKRYVAYKRAGANFACVAVRASSNEILVYLRLDPPPAGQLEPFMRDVTEVGHIGTGDLEMRLSDRAQLAAAGDYLAGSYEAV
jgi:predicted transport protein